jgi:hypothetical protein
MALGPVVLFCGSTALDLERTGACLMGRQRRSNVLMTFKHDFDPVRTRSQSEAHGPSLLSADT